MDRRRVFAIVAAFAGGLLASTTKPVAAAQPGHRVLYRFPPGCRVVAMTRFRDKLVVATTDGLYEWDAESETIQRIRYAVVHDPEHGAQLLQRYCPEGTL